MAEGKRIAPELQPTKQVKKDHTILKLIRDIAFTLAAIAVITAAIIYVLRHWGLEAMLVLFVVISAAMWGWVIRWRYRQGALTISHILVIWMVWTGTILGGASYYLAYLDKTSSLETLSRYVMVEVVAGVGGYFVKAGVENAISKVATHKEAIAQGTTSKKIIKDL